MLKIILAQLNFVVGDIEGNVTKIEAACLNAKIKENADIIVFPELCVSGYPPEDLLFRDEFITSVDAAILQLIEKVKDIHLVLGFPFQENNQLFNSAGVFLNGQCLLHYHKQHLPNYGVFDEQRYFSAGDKSASFSLKGQKIGLSICEDIWQKNPIQQAKQQGVQILLNLNASPFHQGKPAQRLALLQQQAKDNNMSIVYVNLVGGQDELVFDGGSMVVNAQGCLQVQAPYYEENFALATWQDGQLQSGKRSDTLSFDAQIYQALVLAVRDYVVKSGFQGAVLGLSGGIDSALVLAIAVDALGAQNVEVLLMPSIYTADMSNLDAVKQAETLGVSWKSIPIEPAFNAFMDMLSESFEGTERDTTEENLQARCRGILLMAMSNKRGKMLLTTGNKSEMSVGYATLYGDMAGACAPIKDLPKLLVYQLANFCNRNGMIIPQRVIDRPPSAELAPDQKDSDSLPDYAILDEILRLYMEEDKSRDEIVLKGFLISDVARVAGLVDKNEHKRFQSPPGAKVTKRALGRDRRYPLVNQF